jgi:hypothetical protein
MNPLSTIYERYVALFGNDHDTAAVRGKEEQPTAMVSTAAPLFP